VGKNKTRNKNFMSNLNLIWQTQNGDQTSFEQEYILEVLFNEIQHEKIFDNGSLNTVIDNSVIIYSNNSGGVSDDFLNYLNKFKDNNFKFYLLHLSNEGLSHNFEYYKLANHVIRNYYWSDVNLDNCLFIPLGFKSGFYNQNQTYRTLNDKKYDFCFIGQPKSDRNDLITVLNNLGSSFIHTTNQWNCPTSLSQMECKEVYKDTKFVPCPMGWVHPDSFRIMEVLESGSIPVLKTYNNLEYFTKVWGDSPLPTVDQWDELSKLSNMDNENYKKMYQEVIQWYDGFKLELSKKIKNIVL
jgi:hypothetical protein